MNPFEQMSKTLAHRQPVKSVWQPGLEPKSQTRVGAIRDLLKSQARPMSAAEIAYDVDLPSHTQNLVWLLLKYDIQKGRVLFSGGMYAWNAEFDSREEVAIRAAIKLLKKNGYVVTKGGVA
jgi:hypothetical protein